MKETHQIVIEEILEEFDHLIKEFNAPSIENDKKWTFLFEKFEKFLTRLREESFYHDITDLIFQLNALNPAGSFENKELSRKLKLKEDQYDSLNMELNVLNEKIMRNDELITQWKDKNNKLKETNSSLKEKLEIEGENSMSKDKAISELKLDLIKHQEEHKRV